MSDDCDERDKSGAPGAVPLSRGSPVGGKDLLKR